MKLDDPAAFFFGLVASDHAGRDIGLKANTVLSLNLSANNGYAFLSNPSVSIGFIGPNANVRSVQFNANGAVTGVDAEYRGFKQPVSNLVKGQLNDARAATFGPGRGVTSDVVQSLLNTAVELFPRRHTLMHPANHERNDAYFRAILSVTLIDRSDKI